MSAGPVIALAVLLFAALLHVLRLLRPGSMADRIIAVDTLLVVITSGLAVLAAATRDGTYLDLLVVAALLGFVGTALLSGLLRKRER
ncbi:MAG: monovalent cation/H+ antiporter complex subunit F [Acidimicrobiia bacterium]